VIWAMFSLACRPFVVTQNRDRTYTNVIGVYIIDDEVINPLDRSRERTSVTCTHTPVEVRRSAPARSSLADTQRRSTGSQEG
jgi:hypothetical protein